MLVLLVLYLAVPVAVAKLHPHAHVFLVGPIAFPSQSLVSLTQQLRHSLHPDSVVFVRVLLENRTSG